MSLLRSSPRLLLPNSHVVVGSQTQNHVSSVFRLYNSRPNSWVCGDKETTMGATHDTPAKYTLEHWSLINQSNLAVPRVLLLLQNDPRTLQCFPHHWLTWCNQTKLVCVCVCVCVCVHTLLWKCWLNKVVRDYVVLFSHFCNVNQSPHIIMHGSFDLVI